MDWLVSVKEFFGFLSFLEQVPVLRAILGFVLVFFLPGFAWTLVFFRGKQINVLERLGLSFGLSIAVVTISVIVLNVLVGVRITGLNSVLIIILLTIIPLALYFLLRFITRHQKKEE